MTTPINAMIDTAMRCVRCGTPGMFNCLCHEQCSCGWIAERGKPCRNPETRYCSTKVYRSPAHIELHKGDRVVLTFEASSGVGFIPCDGQWSPLGYCGTVAATPRGGRDTVSVRWDGRTTCDRIRISWLERVTP